MLAEEVNPEVYLPGASIYVSRSIVKPEDTRPGGCVQREVCVLGQF